MSRNRQRHPIIGGVVNQGHGDTTKQGRRDKARREAKELGKVARKQLSFPTLEEVIEVDRSKERDSA